MGYVKKITLVFSIIILCTSGLMAQTTYHQGTTKAFDWSFALGYGFVNGETRYEIEFPVDGLTGKSKLKFPIGNDFMVGEASFTVRSRLFFNLDLAFTNNEDAGTMKDYDWYGGLLIAYGEADAKLDGTFFNFNMGYNFINSRKISIGGLIGAQSQVLSYDIENASQWDILSNSTTYYDGKVLDYEVKYYIYYVGIKLDFRPSPIFKMSFMAAYSPYTKAEDEDDHILRYKKVEGDADGTSFLAKGSIRLNFGKSPIFMKVYGSYIKIETEGDQEQYFYGGPYQGTYYSDIDLKIEAEETFVGALIGVTF